MLDYRQTEPGTADIARACPVSPVKPFEYASDVFGKYAFARIADRDNVPAVARCVRNGNAAALSVELYRVIDQVCEHLLEPHRIAPYGLFWRDMIFQLDASVRGL